jgi:OOP family OmpA-OmpF porin
LKQNSKTSSALAILFAAAMAGGAANAAETGFFVDIGAGMSKVDVPSYDLPGLSVDDEDVYFSVGAGFNINKMFAVEAGYVDLGEVSADYPALSLSATTSADGFYFGPRLTLEVSPQFDVYGRVGMLAWEGETTSNFGVSGEDDGTDVYFGIGAAFNFSEQVSLGAEWTRYALESEGEDLDIDTFGAKLKFNF